MAGECKLQDLNLDLMTTDGVSRENQKASLTTLVGLKIVPGIRHNLQQFCSKHSCRCIRGIVRECRRLCGTFHNQIRNAFWLFFHSITAW
jgi:hypothetical protein